MIVVISGMPRSGSTFSFNIARNLLLARGSLHQEASIDIPDVLDRSMNTHSVLIKSHDLTKNSRRLVQLGAVRSICTIRKPEDAIASWMETFGFTVEASVLTMRYWLEMFADISKYSLVIGYDTIDRHPAYSAWRIGRHIGSPSPLKAWRNAVIHSKANVKAMTDEFGRSNHEIVDAGFTQYDPTTHYHRRHVSTLKSRSAAERLPADALAFIRGSLGGYLDEDGEITRAT